MRGVSNGLYYFFEPFAVQLIQQQRHHDRNGKQGELVQGKEQRIEQQIPKLMRVEILCEMLPSYPFAARYAASRHKSSECNLNAVHGQIFEYREVDQRWRQQHVQLPISNYYFPKPEA
jgi:hypothetical protein